MCYGMLELLYSIFLFFLFYFLDDKEVCDCSHMKHHIILCYRPKTLEKGLEEWCQGICLWYIHLIVYIWYTHDWHIKIRIELFIATIDHVFIV